MCQVLGHVQSKLVRHDFGRGTGKAGGCRLAWVCRALVLHCCNSLGWLAAPECCLDKAQCCVCSQRCIAAEGRQS
jgi:hypothetical protein